MGFPLKYTIRFVCMFLFSFSFLHVYSSVVHNVVKNVDVIRANSITQRIVNKNICILHGNVEVLVNHKMHVWADFVEINREEKTVKANSHDNSFVKLEFSDAVMLAEELFLNLNDKTGYAKEVRIHLHEGFISSAYAEKVDDQVWHMDNMVYTPCDSDVPHWSFISKRATFYKNYLLKASGLVFRVADTPVFVWPGIFIPIQRQAGSGFLIPRFSIDKEYGLGIRQDYYWLIAPRCDMTVGVNWVEKKGFAVSDEFRWARDAETRCTLKTQYAEEKNAFVEKGGKIVTGTDKHYWIQGKYFQPLSISTIPFSLLTRVDFGSDKRIGYHFFDAAESPENSFYNSLILRHTREKGVANFLISNERHRWRRCLEDNLQDGLFQKNEQEYKVDVCYLPHFEWNGVYRKFLDYFNYKQHFFIDYATLFSRYAEKAYINSVINDITPIEQGINAGTARIFYEGELQKTYNFGKQLFRLHCLPCLQARGSVLEGSIAQRKGVRFFVSCGAEWVMPEHYWYSKKDSSMFAFQPLVRWEFLPKINWDQWYYMDHWDHLHSKNKIELALESRWQKRDFFCELYISQGYDFKNKSDRFQLTRVPDNEHLLPLSLNFDCGISKLSFGISQEYDVKTFDLMQATFDVSLNLKKTNFFIGALYQKESLQIEREMLSDIPFFTLIGFSMPIGKKAFLHYAGHFYIWDKCVFPLWNEMRPLLHRLSLDYHGHCWGMSLGFEEKRYREYGNWKSEHSITVSVKLDSLGSFRKRFKRPVMYKAPLYYDPTD
jgi:hypothetical protein